jgi:hypothetical protein
MFGLYYTYNYNKYTTESMTKYWLGGGAIVGAVGGSLALLAPATAAHCIGLMGCTLAVILMSSPLATIKTVIETKNTSSMPFVMSLGAV